MNEQNFFNEIKDLPLLSKEREAELGKTIQSYKSGVRKESAIVELYEHNLKLVINEAYKYSKMSSLDVVELYNAGRVGLIKAIYGYNPEKFKTKFSTYAIPWIKQGMRDAIKKITPAKIPVHIVNGAYRLNKLSENGDVSDEEAKDKLDLTQRQLDKIHLANTVSSVSIDEDIEFSSNGSSTTLGDIIADPRAVIPGQHKLNSPIYDCMRESLEELDEMSRDIVLAQEYNDEKTILKDLGEKYGMTGERIRQIKAKALDTLKFSIAAKMNMTIKGENKVKKKRGRPKKGS